MNIINLNKKIQKFVNQTVLTDEVEVRTAKKLNNAIQNFEGLEESVLEQLEALNVNEMKDTYDKIIDELEQVEKDQTLKIIRLKQQLKITEKKITRFENILLTEDNLISEADRKSAYKKSLRLHLLKISSALHIDDNTPPNIIRGFVMVKTPIYSMKPFEFNLSAISQEECTEKIWDLIKFSSYYISEWKELFDST